jgi:hypothetical protein
MASFRAFCLRDFPHSRIATSRDLKIVVVSRLHTSRSAFLQEKIMPGKHGGGHVKNRKKYEALKDKGMSKTRAAKIANSGKEGSRKGGRHSHSHD